MHKGDGNSQNPAEVKQAWEDVISSAQLQFRASTNQLHFK